MRGVGLNPTRTGVLDALRAMGARVDVAETRDDGGEPAGDVTVRAAPLHGTTIGGDAIPRLIDELPALAVAAMPSTVAKSRGFALTSPGAVSSKVLTSAGSGVR